MTTRYARVPTRVAALAEAIRELPSPYGDQIHTPLSRAEANLDNVLDIFDTLGLSGLADAMQWLRDDVRALRRAAKESVLA